MTKEIKKFPDGWRELPSGGGVLLKDGFAQAITDMGKDSLDEKEILRNVEELTNCKFDFVSGRANRWRRASLRYLFSGDMDRWAIARILLSPCEQCAQEAGVKWWPLPSGPPWWVCEACYLSLEAGAPWD